jgi:hypothetical protein
MGQIQLGQPSLEIKFYQNPVMSIHLKIVCGNVCQQQSCVSVTETVYPTNLKCLLLEHLHRCLLTHVLDSTRSQEREMKGINIGKEEDWFKFILLLT